MSQHRHAQELPHGDESEHIAHLQVGLPEELAEYPEDRIEYEKEGKQVAVPLFPVFVEPENDEEEKSLQQCFVKLRRVPWDISSPRKNHGPGYVGGLCQTAHR